MRITVKSVLAAAAIAVAVPATADAATRGWDSVTPGQRCVGYVCDSNAFQIKDSSEFTDVHLACPSAGEPWVTIFDRDRIPASVVYGPLDNGPASGPAFLMRLYPKKRSGTVTTQISYRCSSSLR